MVELGELERNYGEFARRGVRVVAASMDDLGASRQTQSKFPHLVILSDPGGELARAFNVLHSGANPNGKDAAFPTTLLIDSRGIVRWIYRSDAVIQRLSIKELLEAVDKFL